MKLLIDCSNLNAGGGIQVGLSFLYDLQEIRSNYDFIVIMSSQFSDALNKAKIGKRFQLFELPDAASTNLIARILWIKKFENKIKPDKIFTIFGPSYHRSNFPRIMGYAIPHYIYEDSPFFDTLTFKERIKLAFYKKIQIHFFKKGDKLIFETTDAQTKFCSKYEYEIKNTYVVSNRLNQIFLNSDLWQERNFDFNTNVSILCLSANYKHKNLQSIPRVIDHLKMIGIIDFKFVISLNKVDLNFGPQYDSHIEYLGRVPLENLPSLYKASSILFMPTLLECFSTTYLEAMHMDVPIITTTLGFSRNICGDAAIYFDSLNELDAARKIKLLIDNPNMQKALIGTGKKRLLNFGDSMDRTKEYLRIIEELKS